jgi:hypothetical protein
MKNVRESRESFSNSSFLRPRDAEREGSARGRGWCIGLPVSQSCWRPTSAFSTSSAQPQRVAALPSFELKGPLSPLTQNSNFSRLTHPRTQQDLAGTLRQQVRGGLSGTCVCAPLPQPCGCERRFYSIASRLRSQSIVCHHDHPF